MKKIIGVCVIIALTGCYHSIESNTSEQIESDEYVYNVNDLSICKKAEIKDTNIFYSFLHYGAVHRHKNVMNKQPFKHSHLMLFFL